MPNQRLEISTDDIVIASDGKVTIVNPEFARALIQHVKMLAPDTAGIFDNCDCSKRTLGEVALRNVVPNTLLRLNPGTVGIFDNCNCTKGSSIR